VHILDVDRERMVRDVNQGLAAVKSHESHVPTHSYVVMMPSQDDGVR
jgi:hypothetical protein